MQAVQLGDPVTLVVPVETGDVAQQRVDLEPPVVL
jgi:hypothetical protein